MADADSREQCRAIVQRPIAELVALGLAGDLEALEDLRAEIAADLEAENEPPPRPMLTVVQ